LRLLHFVAAKKESVQSVQSAVDAFFARRGGVQASHKLVGFSPELKLRLKPYEHENVCGT
jgi:hypothetical protein